MPILDQIRATMAAKKITQTALAERTGISQGQLSQILSGKVDPRLSTVERILAAIAKG